MTIDEVVNAVLESSPAPQPERSPWHNSEECVIEIRDLEDYIRNSSSGGSPCHPGTEWKQREGNSLCGAVGSLATMPFRYLSRSRSTPQVKGASTDGCSITTTEEAICAFTPGLPDTSTDFLRSENSSDSHDANSNITLPQDPHDDLDGSFSALSMTQSPTFGQVPNFTQQKAMQRSWVGAFKDVVTGRRSDGPNPEASAKSTSGNSDELEHLHHESSFQSQVYGAGNPSNSVGSLNSPAVHVE